MGSSRSAGSLFSVIVMLVVPFVATAVGIAIDPPEAGAFVVDLAELVEADDGTTIQEISGRLLADNGTPIMVVTIDSMGQYVGDGWSIERFARALYVQWGIGHEAAGGDTWNRGILLLVSKEDRQARIELGAAWGDNYNDECNRVMQQYIIPHFKEDAYSVGILEGVMGLETMIQGGVFPPESTKTQPLYELILLVSAAVGVPLLGIFFFDWLKKQYDPEGYEKERAAMEARLALASRSSRDRVRDSLDDRHETSVFSDNSDSDDSDDRGGTGSWS